MIVCAVGATLKELDTVVAAAKVPLPAWLALTLQVPTETSVSVVPLTLQTLAVVEANDTGRPDVALAASAGGAVPRVWLPGELKVMVCAPGATLKVRVTAVAAA